MLKRILKELQRIQLKSWPGFILSNHWTQKILGINGSTWLVSHLFNLWSLTFNCVLLCHRCQDGWGGEVQTATGGHCCESLQTHRHRHTYTYIYLFIDESGDWFMCCALRCHHHRCWGRVELITFNLTVKSEMFGSFMVSSRPLWQMTVVCVNVGVIQSESTSLKLVMMQVLKRKNNTPSQFECQSAVFLR